MKNLSIAIFALIILVTYTTLADYCIPPKYYSGPFTAITKISMGSVSKSSSTTDGYADFTKIAGNIEVTKGSQDSISIDIYYDRSMLSYFAGNINLRVWIDWNQNMVFDEPTETMVSQVQNCAAKLTNTVKAKFKIPADAATGITRMRVYEDMVENDGHITPNPCGYLNSSNQLGQHGECEDYAINVKDGTSITDNNNLKSIYVHPNPSCDNITINGLTGSVVIYNMLGMEVWNGFLTNEMKIDVSNFLEGLYFVRFGNEVTNFIVQR